VATVRTPRNAWVEAALRALSEGGPDAVRVEALAATLGVTKGGFYWHFKNRAALLDEMLDAWEASMTEAVFARVDRHAGDARERLRHLFALAPSADFAVELAIRDWSRRDRAVARRMRGVDTRRMAWIRTLFAEFCDDEEAGARTMLAYSLLIGAFFIAPRPGGRRRSEMVGDALDHLLAQASTRFPP
jgi:AcrR family transcriptional regulator